MPSLTSSISVIIPYYQINPEPLKNAIDSILNQNEVTIPNIIIVDDSSPFPAHRIIDHYFSEQKQHILIIHQPNSGAANARNTGLDHLPESTQHVAFIDSDDVWKPNHLVNAIDLLQNGYDFYFSDHQRVDWKTSKFEQIGLDVNQHHLINNSHQLFEFIGNPLAPIIRDHIIQTSTVVCNAITIAKTRFPVELVLGEDEVFWVKATKASRKIAFSKQIEVYLGKGINISQGDDFGTERSFQLMLHNCRYWRRITELLPDEPQLEKIRQHRMAQLRENMAASVLYRLKRRQPLLFKSIFEFTLNDPLWIASIFKLVLKKINPL